AHRAADRADHGQQGPGDVPVDQGGPRRRDGRPARPGVRQRGRRADHLRGLGGPARHAGGRRHRRPRRRARPPARPAADPDPRQPGPHADGPGRRSAHAGRHGRPQARAAGARRPGHRGRAPRPGRRLLRQRELRRRQADHDGLLAARRPQRARHRAADGPGDEPGAPRPRHAEHRPVEHRRLEDPAAAGRRARAAARDPGGGQAAARRAAERLDPGHPRPGEGDAQADDPRGRQAHATRAAGAGLAARAVPGRRGRRRGDRQRPGRPVRGRPGRRPGAALVHEAPAGARGRPAPGPPRQAVRRRRPLARRQAGVDPLQRDGPAGRPPGRAAQRGVLRDGRAAAGEHPGHEPRPLPGRRRPGALARAQALPADGGHPPELRARQGDDRRARHPAARAADPDHRRQAAGLLPPDRGRAADQAVAHGRLPGDGRRAAPGAGRHLPPVDEGPQVRAQPEALQHLHAPPSGRDPGI
ncbi:MAG: hypothetical protein AVDCRST_MAG30-3391, partial [uncultured Solirubrobacteraceae bacterium]